MTETIIRDGDTVRVVDSSGNRASASWRNLINATFVVDRSRPNTLSLKGKPGYWATYRFEKVNMTGPDEIKVGTYIVAVRGSDGAPLPAQKPRIYSTDSQAKAVALSMSEKHKQTFVIFKAIGEVLPPPVVVTPAATYRAL